MACQSRPSRNPSLESPQFGQRSIVGIPGTHSGCDRTQVGFTMYVSGIGPGFAFSGAVERAQVVVIDQNAEGRGQRFGALHVPLVLECDECFSTIERDALPVPLFATQCREYGSTSLIWARLRYLATNRTQTRKSLPRLRFHNPRWSLRNSLRVH